MPLPSVPGRAAYAVTIQPRQHGSAVGNGERKQARWSVGVERVL